MVTKVTLELDAVALATVQQGLQALELAVKAATILIAGQVKRQLDEEAAAAAKDSVDA
jgi:hypothetical protein